ncbi:MAG TPA: cell division protein ZipA C-terminal FtsZ-binding domain-containing protein [Steroidobacteraceae bacterium]|jgi:cell division protein ZipA|nr:cell division protein ZipA C-terminal FtsZ-binding domain-containing protein [Steroidobacteraceae bacterium]
MAAELRWILLGLSLVLLAGIWWWGARRSAQAPGNAELREIKPSPEPPRHELPAEDIEREPVHAPQVREWVSPLEPLSIRTGEYERVPVLDGPMMVNADPARTPAAGAAATGSVTATVAAPGTGSAGATEVAPARVPTLLPESSDRSAPAPAQVTNSSEQQKIVTVRVCAAGDTPWSGAALLSALELHGLAYGRYQVFHRRHVDGRSLFCVASLIEPGTFDVARMAAEEFRGVTLFAVLPGPVEPLLTIDELFAAARGLAQELSGMVQDAKGIPLSPQRAAAMRDEVARFQAALP